MGGVARLSRVPTSPAQQLVIVMAAPLASSLIGIFFFVLAKIAFGQNSPVMDRNIPLLMSIAGANILLMFHNLARVFPFDGGRLLQMILGLRISTTRAIQIPLDRAGIWRRFCHHRIHSLPCPHHERFRHRLRRTATSRH
jgi:Zn-dependent protease